MTSAVVPPEHGATPIDRAFQLAYSVAYRLMRSYWRVRHPVTHGTLVAIWNAGEVLLVRNSYIPYYSAPGGYVRRHEDPRSAAVREVAEEVGARVDPEQLRLGIEVTHEWEYRLDHVTVFTLDLPERPVIRVDHREVVEACWFTPAQAAQLDVFPPLRQVIEAKL
jgi:8-oxo-dGTP pyrophosphatase MutT (NUDIX family)